MLEKKNIMNIRNLNEKMMRRMATVLEYSFVDDIFHVFKFKFKGVIYEPENSQIMLRDIDVIEPGKTVIITQSVNRNSYFDTPICYYIDKDANDCSVIKSDKYIIRNRPAFNKNNINNLSSNYIRSAYEGLNSNHNAFKQATTLELKSFKFGNSNRNYNLRLLFVFVNQNNINRNTKIPISEQQQKEIYQLTGRRPTHLIIESESVLNGGSNKEYIKLKGGNKRLIKYGQKGGKYYMKDGKKVYIKKNV